eukprot:TRINITY_DN7855_c0_g1_i1.p1 TRINITY_DN7855_c0_g1~~TRINITY_DN7855_c0_g1_i1.p1  ORF type:complete len:617 (-),score=251.02 TRINITY_DN7855_c0_g1_i1:38-1888(-)
MSDESKREREEDQVNEEEDTSIGPPKPKKKKVLKFEKIYVDQLPNGEFYEKSWMHRDVLTHVQVTKRTNFIITASQDGHVKFWKKEPLGIEFVKHFRAHIAAISGLAVSNDGRSLSTVALDQTLKLFDVISFDLINMIKLDFLPSVCEYVNASGTKLAIAEQNSNKIHIFDTKGEVSKVSTVEIHKATVKLIKYNEAYDSVVSCDSKGMIEYWNPETQQTPENLDFQYKTQTDLYEFAKNKTVPTSLSMSPDGTLFACMGKDRQVRVFTFSTGKLYRKYDESQQTINKIQMEEGSNPYRLDSMEFGRRTTVEQELETAWSSDNPPPSANVIFDDSGYFILYPTMIGIKIVNLYTNRVVGLLGKSETNNRFLHISLYQGKIKGSVTTDNLTRNADYDPTLICTSYKKNRFYLFTRRLPEESSESSNLAGRDILNERPTKDEQALLSKPSARRLGRTAVIHTTKGDIKLKLFAEECPKTVENFTVHSKNGYYNNCIFHRVIKGFMIQTGDPLGDGTGGTSIWGHDFEDEFDRTLKHDRPFTLSMANTGANSSNGSQFFITTIPCPSLDFKHTVFGRVVKGTDVVTDIENAKVYDEKPIEDIKIVNISIGYDVDDEQQE